MHESYRRAFECTTEDISSRANRDWEIQANRFAADLLMPSSLVKIRLLANRDPELAHIQALSNEFGTSFEMTARRLTELSDYACALVFSKDNVVRYAVKSECFAEQLCVWKGVPLPARSSSKSAESDPGQWHELAAYWWIKERRGEDVPESVCEQTLCQDEGYKVTLITYD